MTDKFVVKVTAELDDDCLETITNQIWEKIQEKMSQSTSINISTVNVDGLADTIKKHFDKESLKGLGK